MCFSVNDVVTPSKKKGEKLEKEIVVINIH